MSNIKQNSGQFTKEQTPWNFGIKKATNTGRTRFKKGMIPINKGVPHTEEHKKKLKDAWILRKEKGIVISREARLKIALAHKGIPCSEETKKKISISNKGKKMPKEAVEKMRLTKIGGVGPWRNKKRPEISGANHYKWKGGVNMRDKHSLFNPEYVKWRTEVFSRDNWKCKISNLDCKGQLQAHHILNWADYSELRYDINNGIALCHAHHPRGRAKEKRMVSVFMELLPVSKN